MCATPRWRAHDLPVGRPRCEDPAGAATSSRPRTPQTTCREHCATHRHAQTTQEQGPREVPHRDSRGDFFWATPSGCGPKQVPPGPRGDFFWATPPTQLGSGENPAKTRAWPQRMLFSRNIGPEGHQKQNASKLVRAGSTPSPGWLCALRARRTCFERRAPRPRGRARGRQHGGAGGARDRLGPTGCGRPAPCVCGRAVVAPRGRRARFCPRKGCG